MRAKIRWLALLLVFGLVVAACGGGDDTEETTTTAAGGEETTTTAAGGEETTTTAGGEETTTTAAGGEILTDFGVDTENKVIYLGLLSDLTGPFGPLVSAIAEGIRVYWEDVNANGGVNGYTVDISNTVDTVYVVDTHVQLYDEMRDNVVAIQHSTGSPHTVAILNQLAEDSMLAIPLTWYSGWSDPNINSNLLSHGAPYCLESMNGLSYIAEETGGTTLAIVSVPGDYGLDGAAGAKLAAEALGLEIVLDVSGTVIPTDETTFSAAATAIAEAGADIVWSTLSPSVFSAVYGQALAAGYEAAWGGNSPNWSPAFVAPDSPIKDAIARDYYNSTYVTPWFSDEATEARALFEQYSDATPLDYYLEGFVEAKIMHEALLKAFESGDLTRAGVLAAGKSLESVDFGPFAAPETYVGEPNDRVQRQTFVGRPDPDGLAAGTSTGWQMTEAFFTADITAAYEFTEACYSLGG